MQRVFHEDSTVLGIPSHEPFWFQDSECRYISALSESLMHLSCTLSGAPDNLTALVVKWYLCKPGDAGRSCHGWQETVHSLSRHVLLVTLREVLRAQGCNSGGASPSLVRASAAVPS